MEAAIHRHNLASFFKKNVSTVHHLEYNGNKRAEELANSKLFHNNYLVQLTI